MAECRFPSKHEYASKKAARRGMVELYEKNLAGPGRFHVYRCGDHWHVGHVT